MSLKLFHYFTSITLLLIVTLSSLPLSAACEGPFGSKEITLPIKEIIEIRNWLTLNAVNEEAAGGKDRVFGSLVAMVDEVKKNYRSDFASYLKILLVDGVSIEIPEEKALHDIKFEFMRHLVREAKEIKKLEDVLNSGDFATFSRLIQRREIDKWLTMNNINVKEAGGKTQVLNHLDWMVNTVRRDYNSDFASYKKEQFDVKYKKQQLVCQVMEDMFLTAIEARFLKHLIQHTDKRSN